MSYKSQLQTNNNTIVGNNTDLQSILNTINALPNKGGSTEVKTQTKTVTPTKSQQTVKPDTGYDGLAQVTVDAIPSDYITTTDANAVASDIAKDKTAYVNGVKITGTHVCSTGGSDTSDATATAEDIAEGKTAYINGGKVTGTLIVQSYYVGPSAPSNSVGNDGDLYLVRGE